LDKITLGKTHFPKISQIFLSNYFWKFALKKRHWHLLSLTLVNEGTHNSNFVCGFKPPKKKQKNKKQLLIFFTHGIGVRWLLVHQRSCLGSPYLHGFRNEWILLNVLTCCFKYSGSVSLSLSFWQIHKFNLWWSCVVIIPKGRKKTMTYLKELLAAQHNLDFLSFFLFRMQSSGR